MAKRLKKANGYKPRAGASKTSSRGAVCPYCGKRSYYSRKYAKEAAKVQYPTEKLSAYRCLKAPDFVDTSVLWHLGHLSDRVVNRGQDRAWVHQQPPEKERPVPRPPKTPRATVENGKNDKSKDTGE